MTSVASTSSDTVYLLYAMSEFYKLRQEQIAEATTLKQLQALLKSVDPSGFEHTTQRSKH